MFYFVFCHALIFFALSGNTSALIQMQRNKSSTCFGRQMGVTMKKHLLCFIKNFVKCGLTGWCMEIVFTAMNSLRRRDMTLKGNTSLWMFPIYGCAAALAPISRLVCRRSVWFRGLTYMSLIFSTEFLTGKLLARLSLCPWDYGRSRWNVSRLIRLDFAPFWFGAGLLFERLLASSSSARNSSFTEAPLP